MDDQMDFFDDDDDLDDDDLDPVARRDDPDTSWEAARSVDNLTERRAAVYALLCAHPEGLTDEEIAAAYQGPSQSPSGLRTRRNELGTLGLVADSGRRRKLRTGRMAIVWEVA